MTPGARLQAAIEILEALEHTAQPVDRFLRGWFRERRYAGSKDRAAVGERVFATFRHRAAFTWRMGSNAPRALVLASALDDGATVAEIMHVCDGEGYAPAPLTEEEFASLAMPARTPQPLWVRGEFPALLEDELHRRFGDRMLDQLSSMRGRAPVDLRVNTLKATREEVLASLRAGGLEGKPMAHAPHGIRLWDRAGAQGLSRTPTFLEGRFEFQDEAAQIASLLGAAKPGECVLDLGAGAGGKALALAAAMRNEGRIIAYDTDEKRLAQLRPRAERAGVQIIEDRSGELPRERFDAVFIDAPCSGSGTWRRQPELKWRLTHSRLDDLRALQAQLLATAATLAPARLIYATCSLLPSENDDQVDAFLTRHPNYARTDAQTVWQAETGLAPPPGMAREFHATPFTTGTDGFYTAILERRD
ncbi:MAG TPA: RsmB/NOP family class I SAM-dependent RNA methyltransferase [Rhizomicrobium sp.]|jgi:16S rRNA (cytosine967-C5)-methyltransferase